MTYYGRRTDMRSLGRLTSAIALAAMLATLTPPAANAHNWVCKNDQWTGTAHFGVGMGCGNCSGNHHFGEMSGQTWQLLCSGAGGTKYLVKFQIHYPGFTSAGSPPCPALYYKMGVTGISAITTPNPPLGGQHR